MDANGVRNSCEASATNWRTWVSDSCRALSAPSTLSSMLLRARPTWPTSVRGSVSAAGTRCANATAPESSSRLAHLGGGVGDARQWREVAPDEPLPAERNEGQSGDGRADDEPDDGVDDPADAAHRQARDDGVSIGGASRSDAVVAEPLDVDRLGCRTDARLLEGGDLFGGQLPGGAAGLDPIDRDDAVPDHDEEGLAAATGDRAAATATGTARTARAKEGLGDVLVDLVDEVVLQGEDGEGRRRRRDDEEEPDDGRDELGRERPTARVEPGMLRGRRGRGGVAHSAGLRT